MRGRRKDRQKSSGGKGNDGGQGNDGSTAQVVETTDEPGSPAEPVSPEGSESPDAVETAETADTQEPVESTEDASDAEVVIEVVESVEVVEVVATDGSVEMIEDVVETVGVVEADGSVEVVGESEVTIEVLESDEGSVEESPSSRSVAASTGPEPQAASGNPLPRILAVANQKGGVGKTTTSVNLGAALAELNFRVLVIDLDPQGNATTGLGIDARNFEHSMYDVIMRDSSLEDTVEPTSMKNLFVAPATIDLAGAEIELVPAFSRELKLKRAIETVIDDFDFVLIDCPPSLGLITVNALAAADEVLVPIQCEYYALEGLSQLMRNVHLVASNLNAGLEVSTIVLTMYDARTKLSDQVAAEVREHFGNKVCRNIIPRTVRLSEAPSFGQPITAFDPASRGAIAYRELAKEVSGGAS